MGTRRTTSSELWEWVESGEPLDSPEQAVRFLCILQALVSTCQEVETMPADCLCDERLSLRMDDPPLGTESRSPAELDRDYWRNGGRSLRWMARTIREALAREAD